MKISSFYKGQKLLYHHPAAIYEGVVNFIDHVGGKYITLTVGPTNLVIYPQWWDRLTPIDKPPVTVNELVQHP